MKNKLLFGFLLIFMVVGVSFFVSANPYSYDDSMDMKYKKVDGKIIYGYGDGVKYETSLRPKGVNWSEWRKSDVEISRRRAIDKTWAEIEAEDRVKGTESINVFENLINGISNFFLRLIGREQALVDEEDFQNG